MNTKPIKLYVASTPRSGNPYYEAWKNMMKSKPIIVLERLLAGNIIKHNERLFQFDANNEFCERREVDDERKYVLLKVNFGDFSLSDFIDWANRIPDETLTILQMNAVLNNHLQDKAKQRR